MRCAINAHERTSLGASLHAHEHTSLVVGLFATWKHLEVFAFEVTKVEGV